MRSRKILVTGAAGFIGSHLAISLLKRGENILCIDNFNEYYDPDLKYLRKERLDNMALENKRNKENYSFHKVDICNMPEISKIVESYKPDVICHLAAQAGVRYSLEYPQTYVDNNISATVNLLELSKEYNVKDFILASTSSVYGLSKNMPFREDAPIDTTISTYSATKRACELLCHTYRNIYGIRFRILRFFTVYGPWGRPDMALYKFTKSILNNEPIDVYNNGQMTRDFTYVDDIISGFVSSIDNNYDFEIINLGCGQPVKLMDYITILEKNLGKKSVKNYMGMQPGDVESTFADISKARKILNYEPKTSVEIGVKKFVQWYVKNYK